MACFGPSDPTAPEEESKVVAKHLSFIFGLKGKVVPQSIQRAAHSYRGDISKIDEMTEMLCTLCQTMSEAQREAIIYDGHNPKSRVLADWWENHQMVDAERIERKREKATDVLIRKNAIAKLSTDEQRALGFR